LSDIADATASQLYLRICHKADPGRQIELKLNGTFQLLVYVDDVNLRGHYIDAIKKNTRTLTDSSKVVGLEVSAEETKHVLLCRHQNLG
jgi:hypothetical protein